MPFKVCLVLYMATLTACQHNPAVQTFYDQFCWPTASCSR